MNYKEIILLTTLLLLLSSLSLAASLQYFPLENNLAVSNPACNCVALIKILITFFTSSFLNKIYNFADLMVGWLKVARRWSATNAEESEDRDFAIRHLRCHRSKSSVSRWATLWPTSSPAWTSTATSSASLHTKTVGLPSPEMIRAT